jgi:hypothetical protein
MDTVHDQPVTPSRLPSDDLGVVYALSGLPDSIRQNIKTLIYNLAAEYSARAPSTGNARSPARKRQEPTADDDESATAAAHYTH